MQAIVASTREAFESGRTRPLAWRKKQLEQLQLMIEENHEAISAAIGEDHGGPKLRALLDMSPHGVAQFALDHLDEWTADEVKPHAEMLGRTFIRPSPKGVVLIIAPWNVPWFCALGPLVGALAAGNCAVIKPSEHAPACAAAMETLIKAYLDNDCIKVVQGAVPETTELLKCRFDHIFYTGGTAVGRIIMRAAAEHLTPVTLELGGKSPVILDETAQVDVAVQRILMTKVYNVGQLCIAADYVLVHRSLRDAFVEKYTAALKKHVGEDAANSTDYGKIINAGHLSRLQSLMSDVPQDQIVTPCTPAGNVCFDAEQRYAAPALVLEPSLDAKIMQEEIFGPLLAIKTFDTLPEAMQMVRKVCAEPLGLYVFSENQRNIEYVLQHSESGGVCVNSVMEQVTSQEVPFGGKGPSGQGAWGGKYGFDACTHHRTVFVKDSTFNKGPVLPIPPIPSWLYDVAVKVQILGIVPKPLRKFKKAIAAAIIVALYMLLRRRRRA